MLRVGLIGNGGIAGNHKGAYRTLPSVKLEAICDVHAEQLLQTEGLRTYTDYLQMLEQEQGRLDFVDLCVPTALHAEISIKAMEMGYHVLCEKPMARTVEQAQAMLDVSSRTVQRQSDYYQRRDRVCQQRRQTGGAVKIKSGRDFDLFRFLVDMGS